MKSGAEAPFERFDEAQRRQGHALWVGRKSALARSLDCQIASAIWLRSLTPRTLFRLHHGLVGMRFGPSYCAAEARLLVARPERGMPQPAFLHIAN